MRTTVSPDGTVTVDTDPVAKSTWDGETTSHALVKSEAAQRYTLSVGYPADLADALRARDGHRDFASRVEVEKAAWNYMRNGPKVGLLHADGTEGTGDLVESYIYRGPDWDVDGQIIKDGDWLIGVVWNQPTWDAIEAGRLRGTSLQGSAGGRRTPSPADVARVKARG